MKAFSKLASSTFDSKQKLIHYLVDYSLLYIKNYGICESLDRILAELEGVKKKLNINKDSSELNEYIDYVYLCLSAKYPYLYFSAGGMDGYVFLCQVSAYEVDEKEKRIIQDVVRTKIPSISGAFKYNSFLRRFAKSRVLNHLIPATDVFMFLDFFYYSLDSGLAFFGPKNNKVKGIDVLDDFVAFLSEYTIFSSSNSIEDFLLNKPYSWHNNVYSFLLFIYFYMCLYKDKDKEIDERLRHTAINKAKNKLDTINYYMGLDLVKTLI